MAQTSPNTSRLRISSSVMVGQTTFETVSTEGAGVQGVCKQCYLWVFWQLLIDGMLCDLIPSGAPRRDHAESLKLAARADARAVGATPGKLRRMSTRD